MSWHKLALAIGLLFLVNLGGFALLGGRHAFDAEMFPFLVGMALGIACAGVFFGGILCAVCRPLFTKQYAPDPVKFTLITCVIMNGLYWLSRAFLPIV